MVVMEEEVMVTVPVELEESAEMEALDREIKVSKTTILFDLTILTDFRLIRFLKKYNFFRWWSWR